MVIVRGAGYAETCKSGSGGGLAGTAGENQYGAAKPTSLPHSILVNEGCSYALEMLQRFAAH